MRFRRAPAPASAALTPPTPRAVRRALPPPAQLRRERRSLLAVREQRLRDLGGLLLEMYRRDQLRQDLLVNRCADLLGDEVLRAVRQADRRGARAAGRVAMSEPAPRDYCPRCGVAYEPLQEYCLECGARLPTNRGVVGVLATAWQRRLAWYPGDWIWPVLLFLVLTIVATSAAVAANATRSKPSHVVIATTPSVSVGPGATRGTVPPVSTLSTLPSAPAPTFTTGPLPTAPGSKTGSAPP